MSPNSTHDRIGFYKLQVLSCLLWVGGIIAILDGFSTNLSPRAIIRFTAGAISLLGIVYLRRTSDVRRTTLVISFSSGIVFLSDYALYGDPIYLAIGFSVPIISSLLLGTKDACYVLAAYGGCGLLLSILLQQQILVPPFLPPPPIARSIAAMTIICAVAGPVMWMQRLLSRFERDALEQRHRFESICDNGISAFFESNEFGRITFVRGKLIEKLGYEYKDIIGQHHFDRIVATDRRKLAKTVTRQDKGYSYNGEIRVRAATGEKRWIRLSGFSSKNSEGKNIFLNSIEDIHDAVKQRQHLFELARLESLGTVCGGLAHDFNNLLMVIGIRAEAIENDVTRREILQAQQHATDLTAGLLTFARKQTYRDQNVDLNDFFDSIRSLIEQLAPANIKCTWNIECENIIVRIDPAQIQQVIINLVNNSCQAMPDGGKLTIGLTSIRMSDEEAQRQQIEKRDLAQITVTDTGSGMDAETASRAIEPFFTTKPRGLGTGLGLATAHGALKRAGGSIAIVSQPGFGTEISLLIPLQTRTTSETPRTIEHSAR